MVYTHSLPLAISYQSETPVFICGVLWLILIIAAVFKRNGKIFLFSLIFAAISIIAIAVCEAKLKAEKEKFDSIPLLSVEDNIVTIMDCDYEGLSCNSTYIMADGDENGVPIAKDTVSSSSQEPRQGNVLKETDRLRYSCSGFLKFGYSFRAINPGIAYICILETVHCDPHYLDIYRIDVNGQRRIQAEKIYHITDDIVKNLPEGFEFAAELIEMAH